MSDKIVREGRVTSLLHKTISQFLIENCGKDSLITVSFVQLNKSQRTINVYCSVFPFSKRESALKFLKRREGLCSSYIKKNTSIRLIPVVRFSLVKEDTE